MIRLENLQDKFDYASEPVVVDKEQLVKDLWYRSNPNTPMPSYKLVETSITGNMPVEEMEARRIHWKTTDSSEVEEQLLKVGNSTDCKVNFCVNPM